MIEFPPLADAERTNDRLAIDPLDHVRDWIFDLDNTLYPASSRLFEQVSRLMTEFIAETFGLGWDEAAALRRRYFQTYGTTLRGLMTVHGIDPHDFLRRVHDIDLGALAPSSALAAALDALPGRKLIYTNGTVAHAERILERLGIAGRFEDIVDIVAADYIPKPDAAALGRVVDKFALQPPATAMVEDIAHNLAPAAALGMTTVWVRTDFAAGQPPPDGDAIHHVIDDLGAWLAALAAARRR